MSESAVRDCCPRKRMISWNRAKRSWDGSPPAPAQILGHWPWRLPFSWRVTWKSNCCHFQEARTSSVNPVNLVILDLLSLLSRWVGARRTAFLRTTRCDWEKFKKCSNSKWFQIEIQFFGSWNAEDGESSAFQCTTYLRIFRVDFRCKHFILHLTHHFDRLLERVGGCGFKTRQWDL
jgi:hypothetical protein